MADQHGAHQTDEAHVVSLCEDFCKSPDKPVGYMISQKLNMSSMVCGTVNGCGTPVLNMSSRITSVTGNEAGVGGGVVSGVNIGMCKPVENSAPKVRAEGKFVLRHDTVMEMNCAGPEGFGNTKGKVVYVKNSPKAEAGKNKKNAKGGRHYSQAEVVSMMKDIKDRNLLQSFFDHNGNGKYDFKIREPNATFDVFGTTMNSGQYGNFLAGFAGQVNGGLIGTAGVKLGGILFDAADTGVYKAAKSIGLNPPLPPGGKPPKFDFDKDSAAEINFGVFFGENPEVLEDPDQLEGSTQEEKCVTSMLPNGGVRICIRGSGGP